MTALGISSTPPSLTILWQILGLLLKNHLVCILGSLRLSLQFLPLCSDGLILMCTGPIVPLLSWTTEEEAITLANNTHMGLGASVWSSNIERANKIARQIDAGNVWVNGHFELDPRFPFGGHKESGIGHEWGVAGLKSFCNVQTLYLKKPQNA